MASQADNDELPGLSLPRRRRRRGRLVLLGILLLLIAGLAAAWLNRETIAANVIASELERRGIDARYKIERIGGRRQVLRDVIIGEPGRPDLTIARAEIVIAYRFGFPAIERVYLQQPRLFGTLRNGALSFGALDPLLFTGEEGPFEFPDLALAIEDGRALIEGDRGPMALRVSGEGHLRGGFSGELAAVAPRLALAGCEPFRTTLYGRVAIEDARPRFAGPLRFGALACPSLDLASAGGAVQLDARAGAQLEKIEGQAAIRAGGASSAGIRLTALSGTSDFTWRDGGLTAAYDLQASNLATQQAGVARLDFTGTLRARRQFERVELEAQLEGRNVRLGSGVDRLLAEGQRATSETLLGPLLRQARTALIGQSRGSRLTAATTVRRVGQRTILAIESARLRGGSGTTLLALSRFQHTTGGGTAPRFAGQFAIGGEGLPRVAGQMEQKPGGALELRLAMAEYRTGTSRLAIPELTVVAAPDGALNFAGEVRASGALPGGLADNLALELSGRRTAGGEISVWPGCTTLRFDRLQLANLALARHALRLCPPPGGSIVRLGPNGLRIAAGAPELQLAGHLGETPLNLRSGPVGIAYPGALTARRLDVTLGPPANAARFAVADLTAELGRELGGRFEQADVQLAAVPLDLLAASGSWRYAGGRLSIADGSFRLQDRAEPDRFHPLTAIGATLVLESNVITAKAPLREPRSGRLVTELDLRHDLVSGSGHANLEVPGLLFDASLQPVDLTPNATGVVALVRGTVTGLGRIEWDAAGLRSRGRFSSEALDFAAAFGPVRGAAGTIEFTDLLGLTTAPNQRLRVASINPGIEVTGGEIGIQVRGGQVLALQGGTWPFMGGTLTLRPIDIRLDASEEDNTGEIRRYVLEIVGLSAARFIERMELNNLAATGTFDGTVPIVFDERGNGRLEGGLLLSRPPGGNVSYVGELTYENLGAVANFAFDTLRSLDYRQMSVGIDGSLTGEIITRVRLDGVSQGASAKQNLLTRTIAGLPIRLDVNVRAPFFQLLSSTRALYDPAAILDPRSPEVGLLDSEGNPIPRGPDGLPLPVAPPNPDTDPPLIQRRESEDLP